MIANEWFNSRITKLNSKEIGQSIMTLLAIDKVALQYLCVLDLVNQ
jgi:hypothetical protein